MVDFVEIGTHWDDELKVVILRETNMADRLGWILVHSDKVFNDGSTPQELLSGRSLKQPWHWRLAKPLNEGGPYTLLMAWKGVIFAQAIGDVTHRVKADHRNEYNFAFKLSGYMERKPVALADLKVRPYHSLVVLTPEILQAYRRLAD